MSHGPIVSDGDSSGAGGERNEAMPGWTVSGLAGEAVRDTMAPRVRYVLLVGLLAGACAWLSIVEMRSFGQAQDREQAFETAGLTTAVLRFEDTTFDPSLRQVLGQSCIALDSARWVSAGPIAEGSPLRLTAQPRTAVPRWFATSGTLAALGAEPMPPPDWTLVAPATTGESLKLAGDGDTLNVWPQRETLRVSAVVETGQRDQRLSVGLIEHGSRSPWASCIVDLPATAPPELVEGTIAGLDGPLGSVSFRRALAPDEFRQLPADQLEGRQSRHLWAALAGIFALIWALIMWSERPAIGLYRSLGAGRWAMGFYGAVQVWTVLAPAVTIAVCAALVWRNSGEWPDLPLPIALRPVVLAMLASGSAGVVVAALAGVGPISAAVKE